MTRLKSSFKGFLLLLSVFIGFRAMALNPMCHSPVQLAALMSPNKPKVSANQTRIRQLEKGVTKYEDSISEAEDLLAESLNPDKLGDSEYNVASDIRDYIEDEQNGWPCADPSSLLYFKGLFYSYGNLLEALLPYAYADPNLARECADSGGLWDMNTQECQDGKTAESAEEPAQTESSTPDSQESATETGKVQEAACLRDGKVWKNEKCVPVGTFDGVAEELACRTDLGWTWKSSRCVCKTPKITDGEKCRKRTEKENCIYQKRTWTNNTCQCEENFKWNGYKCAPDLSPGKVQTCPDGKVWKDEKCVPKTDFAQTDEEANCQTNLGWTWENSQCVCKSPKITDGEKCRIQEQEITIVEKPEPEQPEAPSDCPDWKQDPSFKSKGRVEGKFCDNFAKDIRKCKESLSKMQRLAKTLNKYRDRLERAEEASEQEDPSETEAGGLCFDCLKRELQANRPSPGQNLGNFLSLLTGTGMTYLGHKMGQTAQMDTNMLRIQQGYPVQQNYFALNGASAGFPFLSNGIYGLTRTNTPTGGWACSPSVSPYGGAYNYGMNYGYSMPYF